MYVYIHIIVQVWLRSPGAPRSPLRSAVQAQDGDMVRLLLQARADPNERDAKGVCVPRRAFCQGHVDNIMEYV